MSKNAVFVEGKFEKNGQEQEEKGNHVPRMPRDGRYQLRTFAQARRGETPAEEIQSSAPTGHAPYRKAQVICSGSPFPNHLQGEFRLALFVFCLTRVAAGFV